MSTNKESMMTKKQKAAEIDRALASDRHSRAILLADGIAKKERAKAEEEAAAKNPRHGALPRGDDA